MFKTLLLVAVVAVTAMTLIGQSAQAERIDQQALLLERLEEVNHPSVSQLVDEWRVAYPSPSAEELTELRVLLQRVKADPASAHQYTTSAKQAQLDKIESVISTPFGWAGGATAKPEIARP